MFIVQIQPFDEKLYGETVIKSGNYHYLAIQYNTDNFFGIGAFNPFKNVSRTVIENKNNQAPFRRKVSVVLHKPSLLLLRGILVLEKLIVLETNLLIIKMRIME